MNLCACGHRRFVAAALVLGAAAVGLHPAIEAVATHYTKGTIEIVRPFAEFDPGRLPSFEPSDQLRSLWWSDQDIGTREKRAIGLVTRPEAFPKRIEALLTMAYYSDPRHQVPHTPEVCFRQDGGVVQDIRTVEIDAPGLDGRRPLRARLVQLQRPGERVIIDTYCFVSNGTVYHDREKLRWAIGFPGDRYVYFAKVETAVVCVPGVTIEDAAEVTNRLLSEALPILIEDHLPSYEQVRRR
jgi:hypothetical protein